MPFSNLTAEETARLGDLLRSDALRPHQQPWDDGCDVDPTSTDPASLNQMAYVDRVFAVLDDLQYRHARAQTTAPASASPPMLGEVVDAVERAYPFPSLFLNSPRDVVLRSWAAGLSAAERRELAATVTDERTRPEPPGELLSLTAAPPHSGRAADGVPHGDRAANTNRSDHGSGPGGRAPPTDKVPTAMYTLDLTRSRQAAARVVVALQAEASLALSVDYTGFGRAAADPSTDSAAVYLVSPDATTCVLVACRVSLHPEWQTWVAAFLDTHTGSPARGGAGGGPDVEQGLDSHTGSTAVSLPQFLSLTTSTRTAAMAHLDRAGGAVNLVSDMLWNGAVPAWLHALAAHAHGLQGGSDESARPAARVEAALRALHMVRAATAAAPPPLLLVEWYLVGGLRERTYTAPILTELFAALFPHTPAEPVNKFGRPDLLASEVALATLLAQPESTTRTNAGEGVSIHLEHRLREDGLGLWSANTTFRSWSMDRNDKNLYAFPMCYGMLLSVKSGAAWPCTFAPAGRSYPLHPLRTLFGGTLHCTFPREHERACGSDRDEAATMMTTEQCGGPTRVLSVRRQTFARARVLAELWLAGHDTPPRRASRVGNPDRADGGARAPPTPLTLLSYTAECLAVLRHQQGIPTSDGAAHTPASTTSTGAPSPWAFPLLLRMRLPDLWSRRRCGPGELSARELPEQVFLQTSTTPHCEPVDFTALAKAALITQEMVGPGELYQALVGEEGEAAAAGIDADGILLCSYLTTPS